MIRAILGALRAIERAADQIAETARGAPAAQALREEEACSFVGLLSEIRTHHGETYIRIDRHKPEDEGDVDHRRHRAPQDVCEVAVPLELAQTMMIGTLCRVSIASLEPGETHEKENSF